MASNTLNTYLSMMVTGGEAVRKGDFYVAATPAPRDDDAPDADPDSDADEHDESDA